MELTLFFTRGVSLKTWINQGLFDREKLIYEEHLNQGNFNKIYWFTYGSKDKKISEKLKKEKKLHENIEVYGMPKIFNMPKIGTFLYSLFLPFYCKKIIQKCDILKTNQMDGSWSAIIAKLIYKKRLIVRTGYTLSQLEYSKHKNSLKYKYYVLLEKFAYKYCDIAMVTSQNNKKYLLENKFLFEDKISVVPNFIDVNLFKPLNLKRYKNRILFVGRLNKEKNLYNLIEAISKTDLTLDIYGQGELRNNLEKFAKEKKASVNFMSTVPNKELVNIYNSYKYYILPSFFEGMPKTLLEAMACGCICIGTDVNGINEVIRDKFNGILIKGTTVNDILETINNVITINYNNLVKNGIENIIEDFSLQTIINQEKKLVINA